MTKKTSLPKIGLLYLDYVLRFFDKSNFKGWPDKIEQVTYHWGNDKDRFIAEVKRKKIDVLIGNIPATAYETFRDIARALPEVRFLPSLDSQFSNKSKENVTHFCRKYDLPIPHTEIFYIPEKAQSYLASATYPKIIKRSYGPSNYGGYFVHKVDSYEEAQSLLSEKRYYQCTYKILCRWKQIFASCELVINLFVRFGDARLKGSGSLTPVRAAVWIIKVFQSQC